MRCQRIKRVPVKRALTVFSFTNLSKQPAYQYIDFQKRPSFSARLNSWGRLVASVINTRTFYKIYHIYFELFWRCLVHRLNHKAKYPCLQSKSQCSKFSKLTGHRGIDINLGSPWWKWFFKMAGFRVQLPTYLHFFTNNQTWTLKSQKWEVLYRVLILLLKEMIFPG